MTTEEAIAWFERGKRGITMSGANAMYDMAIAALRAQQEAKVVDFDQVKNEPLTLEELRQMDGEPVWIERCGSNSPEDKEWALVFVGGGFCRTSVGNIAFLALYGQTWLAYRRKPKEGT